MKEVEAQTKRKPAPEVARKERVVRGVRVLVGNAAGGLFRMKGTAIPMRGDAKSRVILQSAERAPLSCFRRQQFFPKRLQRELECRSGDRAVCGDHHTLGFQ